MYTHTALNNCRTVQQYGTWRQLLIWFATNKRMPVGELIYLVYPFCYRSPFSASPLEHAVDFNLQYSITFHAKSPHPRLRFCAITSSCGCNETLDPSPLTEYAYDAHILDKSRDRSGYQFTSWCTELPAVEGIRDPSIHRRFRAPRVALKRIQ